MVKVPEKTRFQRFPLSTLEQLIKDCQDLQKQVDALQTRVDKLENP